MGVLTETVKTLREESFAKMNAIQKTKLSQIKNYFRERFGDINVLSSNSVVANALQAFNNAFNAQGGVNGAQWRSVEQRYAKWLTQYKEQYGYYDLFLISRSGNVVYSVEKESELAQNLVNGELNSSSLGKF